MSVPLSLRSIERNRTTFSSVSCGFCIGQPPERSTPIFPRPVCWRHDIAEKGRSRRAGWRALAWLLSAVLKRRMDAIVIGGGIGGLTLALALHAAGVARRIRVYDAAAEMRAIGIGIHIGSHAMKELSTLGLEDALVATSCQPEDYAFFTRHGQFAYRQPFG